MIFNSFNFLIIFPFLFLLYYLIPERKQSWRNIYLLLVSYLLYMNFKPVYAIILFGITAITFYTAKIIEKNKTRRNKYILDFHRLDLTD